MYSFNTTAKLENITNEQQALICKSDSFESFLFSKQLFKQA